MSLPFTFDRFAPGAEIGRHDLVLDRPLIERWRLLFPDAPEGELMPAGMTVIVTTRAYAEIVAPRPPGNVHGAQRFEIIRLPRIGERLTTTFSCLAKELRKERRWVHFDSATRGEDGAVRFRGRKSVLWAA